VRQLLTENILLATVGALAGLLLAAWGVRMLVGLAPAGLPRLDEVGMNLRVLGFTFGVSVLAGVLFGLAPVLQMSAAPLAEWLRDRDTGSERRQARLWRHALVVVEVALAMVLLVGAGLLVRSFQQLRAVDPGFRPAHVLTLRAAMPQGRYDVPLVHDRQGTSLWREGEAPPSGAGDRVVNWTLVSPGYFETMGIPIRRGRSFVSSDRVESAPVILIDEAVAQAWFPGEDPIGRRVFFGARSGTAREIVGIVGRERHDALERDPHPGVYLPYFQWPNSFEVSFVLRTTTTAAGAAGSARAALRAADGGVPVFDLQTLDQVLSEATAQPRFSALLVGLFAIVALMLAAVGIYGVMSYTVSQRTREIGLRVALGAQPGQVRRLIVGQAMTLAAVGIALGTLGALALGRTLSSLLFEVTPTDGGTFLVVTAVLGTVVLVACYVPAHRATRVDPMVALRAE